MTAWTPISVVPPMTPRNSFMGGDMWSGWLLGRFPDHPTNDLPPGCPAVHVVCAISYPGGSVDWFTPISANGGLDLCESHGYPAPDAWMAVPQ